MTRLITFLGSLSLVFFLATGSIYADSPSSFFASAEGLIVNVPFDFYVGHQTLPAGEYRLVPVVEGTSLYRIYNRNGNHSAYLATTFVQTVNDSKSVAVFTKNGRHNVLSEFPVAGGVRTVSAVQRVQTAESIAFERMEASWQQMRLALATIAAEQAEMLRDTDTRSDVLRLSCDYIHCVFMPRNRW